MEPAVVFIGTMGRHWRRRGWRVDLQLPRIHLPNLPQDFPQYLLLGLLAAAAFSVSAFALLRTS